VEVRIDRVKGNFGRDHSNGKEGGSPLNGMYKLRQYRAQCSLYYNGQALCRPVSTKIVSPSNGGKECVWDERVSFCVKYRDLPQDTLLAVTVWPSQDPLNGRNHATQPMGGCTLKLFSKKLRLRSGSRKLRLWLGREACGRENTATPGKIPLEERGQTGLLERQLKHYNRGDMAQMDELDKLCIAKIYDKLAQEEQEMTDKGLFLLQLELAHFPLPVLFQVAAASGSGGGINSLHSQGSFNAVSSQQSAMNLDNIHDILQSGHTISQR